MVRSKAFDAAVVGLLAALVSFCALQASGAEPYSVVAQSTAATAGQGRRPLSQRIASGRLPLRPVVTEPVVTEAAAAPTEPPVAATTADTARDAVLQRVKTVLSARHDPELPSPPEARPTRATVATLPARLEFDIRESQVVIAEGERVIVNIAVRNIGPTTARRVETALFFADGIEPVKTTGHGAAIAAGEVRLEPIESLEPGDSAILAVTAVGVRPGPVAYRGELACAELPGVLAREGALQVEPRDEAPLTGATGSD